MNCKLEKIDGKIMCRKCGYIFPKKDGDPNKIYVRCGKSPILKIASVRRDKIAEYKTQILDRLKNGSFIVADFLKGCQSCIPAKRAALDQLRNEGIIVTRSNSQ
jgi:hypothetical protein